MCVWELMGANSMFMHINLKYRIIQLDANFELFPFTSKILVTLVQMSLWVPVKDTLNSRSLQTNKFFFWFDCKLWTFKFWTLFHYFILHPDNWNICIFGPTFFYYSTPSLHIYVWHGSAGDKIKYHSLW